MIVQTSYCILAYLALSSSLLLDILYYFLCDTYYFEEYVKCLTTYFDMSKATSKVTMPDLRNVLGGIQKLVVNNADEPIVGDDFQVGEHIVAISDDEEGNRSWELAVIESSPRETVIISAFIPTKRNRSLWVFPEEARVIEVDKSRIIMRRVQVFYHKTLHISCSLSREVLDEIETLLKSM